ncbi:MAG: hypothetical protein AAB074_18185 [Planctomycetota bacterium]
MEIARSDVCGACGVPVGKDATTCPSCFARRAGPPGPTRGKKLGGCLLAITLLIPAAAWLAAAIRASWRAERESTCKTHVQQIGVFREMYRKKFSVEPQELRSLYRPEITVEMGVFACPVTETHKVPWDGDWGNGDFVSYEYRNAASAPTGQPYWLVAWDRIAHPDGRRCVLYLDGTIAMLDERTFVKLRDAK